MTTLRAPSAVHGIRGQNIYKRKLRHIEEQQPLDDQDMQTDDQDMSSEKDSETGSTKLARSDHRPPSINYICGYSSF